MGNEKIGDIGERSELRLPQCGVAQQPRYQNERLLDGLFPPVACS